jgi:hypothetical protein
VTVVQAFFPKSSMVYDSPQYCKHERVKKKKRYSSAFTSLEVGSGIVILVIMFYVQWHVRSCLIGKKNVKIGKEIGSVELRRFCTRDL